jgi:hypothetical protein
MGPAKAESNLRKHGVSFAEATKVFADPLSTTTEDPQHSDSEDRFLTLGMSYRNRLVVVAHTDRGDSIRIISARKALPHEKRDYEHGEHE